MAEVFLAPDDDQQVVARELLEKAASPDHVHWSPRPDTPHGGVYVVDDGLAEEYRQARAERREREAAAIEARMAAAAERDDAISGTDLTPSEAGFAANTDAGADLLAVPARQSAEQDVEAIAARVHDAWMETKLAEGVTSRKSESGEELMVPYDQLSEAAKDLDRSMTQAVLDAQAAEAAAKTTTPAVDESASTEPVEESAAPGDPVPDAASVAAQAEADAAQAEEAKAQAEADAAQAEEAQTEEAKAAQERADRRAARRAGRTTNAPTEEVI